MYQLSFTNVNTVDNRRDIDTQNDWTRMECTDGLVNHSEDLLAQLIALNGSFIDVLPMVNGSSPVISGEFSFSSNESYHTH